MTDEAIEEVDVRRWARTRLLTKAKQFRYVQLESRAFFHERIVEL